MATDNVPTLVFDGAAFDQAMKERAEGRRTINGRVELLFVCPQLCHGMGGPCRYCHDRGDLWDRPKPYVSHCRGGLVRKGRGW